ncbi:MAG: hypothetical protein WCS37_16925 [Chloroflexota bacterium]
MFLIKTSSSITNSNQHLQGALVGLLLFMQLSGLALGGVTVVRAENFVETAFEQQWRTTDEAVAAGKVARTFFWGPQPFAHTSEVYAESPNNGQRRVQYFDKARMELSKRPTQDPNAVTNGLLTVELVSGQMQVGDNTFLQHLPANNPVAGDPVNNDLSPTYASFNYGKLAFGLPEAIPSTDRTGQAIVEALNQAGVVSSLEQPPVSVNYSRFFSETKHNVAEVFYKFFQTEPLGETRWLDVMGYPISEPFWAKDKVVLAGQPREVMIQLFQRRVLTYTPSNPAGFQVEMGNIGQHYYAWRYQIDLRGGPMPGNFRLIVPQNLSLLSSSIRKVETASRNVRLGEVPGKIYGIWSSTQGTTLIGAESGVYLASLATPGAFKKLAIDAIVKNGQVQDASWSADGRQLAVLFASRLPDQYNTIVYNKSVVQIYQIDNLVSSNTFVAYDNLTVYDAPLAQFKFSPDGKYLAFFEPSSTGIYSVRIDLLEISSRNQRQLKIGDYLNGTQLEWVAETGQLIASMESMGTDTVGKVLLINPASGASTTLLENPALLRASVSPDGNYLAAMFKVASVDNPGVMKTISFRKLSNPTVEIVPSYQQGTGGRSYFQATFAGWSRDGSYLAIRTTASGTAGIHHEDFNLVSLATGKPIQQTRINTYFINTIALNLAGPHQVLRASSEPNPVTLVTTQTLTVRNLDGSDEVTLFSSLLYTYQVNLAQVIQVPLTGS